MGLPETFPEGFLWGAATAAHQVEGGNVGNDWWAAEEAGLLPHASGEACGSWERYEADLDLAAGWHHGAHRFSLEWSRVEPAEGRFDEAALGRYAELARAARARGLEPLVTLHHFTTPRWLAEAGGWTRRDAPRRFARYVERAAAALPEVGWWLTVNEPTVLVKHGYVEGEWPPFERSWNRARRALRGLAAAHRAAREVLRRRLPGARVGFAHGAPWIAPCDPGRALDRLAGRLREELWDRVFLRWIGGAAGLDFLGLNYYTRTLVRSEPAAGPLGLLLGRACHDAHHADHGPWSTAGTEVWPRGLELVLARFARLGVPLVVTENGVATDDEGLRRRVLRDHLEALARALARGVDVRGYLYWSLVDNYEWLLGRTARYGLAAVDFATQERTPRAVAADFAAVCRANGLAGLPPFTG